MFENRLLHCRHVGRRTITAGNGAKANPYYTVFNTEARAGVCVFVCVCLCLCVRVSMCVCLRIFTTSARKHYRFVIDF